MQAQGIWSAGPGDDEQQFLADLRALRDAAALDYDELAARTHYPDDILKDAESGPSLPGLPVLAAYVRACDGDVPEWEERWRRLSFGADADPGLPARPAGASPAAEAGARASVGVAPPDAYDPDRIRAVLRGIHQPEQSAADRGSAALSGAPATAPRPQEYAASWSAATSQDLSWSEAASPGRAETAEDTVRLRPGWDSGYQASHPADSQTIFSPGERADYGADGQVSHQPDGQVGYQAGEPVGYHADEAAGSPGAGLPDEARAEAIRRDPFSADWLQDSELTSRQGSESSWSDQPDAASAADTWFSRGEAGSREAPADAATESWFAPRDLTEAGVAPSIMPDDRVDPGFRPPADYRSPAEGHTVPRAVRPADHAAAGTTATAGPGSADRTGPAPRPQVSLASAPSVKAASSGAPSGPARERRPDRVSLIRLLAVIVVAAIIGSVLVLVLH